MTKEFNQCLHSRRIFIDPEAVNLADKELESAQQDLKEAEDRFKNKKYKYATHTAYYAYFHTARALVYSCGYRERSHYCLMHAIEELFVKKKTMSMKYARNFLNSLTLREDADYAAEYSQDGAEICIKNAKEFIIKTLKILKK
ncbi:MAG: HEPN domain-containing protein [Patescibacteria group bacterium]